MLAALLHDAGKPATRSVDPDGRIRFLGHETVGADLALARATELRLSTEEGRRVSLVVANHLRPLQLAAEDGASRRAIYRFFSQTGAAGVDIVLLSLADFLADFPSVTREHAVARLLASRSQIVVQSLSSRLRELKLYRPSSLPLADARSIGRIAGWCDVIDL